MKDHLVALECDMGPFKPLGFEITGGKNATEMVTKISSLLGSIGATKVVGDGGGADIDPMKSFGVPTMSPHVANEHYFWYHHARSDRMTALNADDMDALSASLAAFMYVVADMDERFPRD